jgi:hypothetical protein
LPDGNRFHLAVETPQANLVAGMTRFRLENAGKGGFS